MTESALLKKIRLTAGKIPGLRLFRNNIAQGWVGTIGGRTARTITLKDPRPLHAGLHKGSGDLIGWTPVTITPEMVGMKLAVFTSVEVKTPRGRLRLDQMTWMEQVQSAGGIAIVVRQEEDLDKILQCLNWGNK